MKVEIPNSAFLGNINHFLHGIEMSDPEVLEIGANPKWFSVHPVVLAILGSLGLRAQTVKMDALQSKSRHYLQRMGLFNMLNLSEDYDIVSHASDGRFIPLTKIQDADQLSEFVVDMIPLLHLEPTQASAINYVVSELVRNVIEHAMSPHGAIVCAQYYQKSHMIRLGIVDSGIGIRESLSRAHPADSEQTAIQYALTPGITGTTTREGGTELNAGAGLFFIKSMAQVNRDFFMMYSGKTLYKLLKRTRVKPLLHADPFKDRHTVSSDYPHWQGTVIGIDIGLEDTPDFPQLLDLIHTTYIKSIRERKKQKYKRRPRFL